MRAINTGTFVWADSQNLDFTSSAANQFLIRAAGGVGIGVNRPLAALHVDGNITKGNGSGDYHQFRLGGGNSGGVAGEAGGSLADSVVNSALRYRAQAPLIDKLLHEIGIDASGVDRLTVGLTHPAPAALNGKEA